MNRYAVIGNPIEQSKSPQIHLAFARQQHVAISYQRILADKERFVTSVSDFVNSGGVGLNVTVPFKVLACQECNQLDEYARAAKAVNTISFHKDKGWLGANTDGIGLLRDLKKNMQVSLARKNILGVYCPAGANSKCSNHLRVTLHLQICLTLSQ